MVAFIHCLSDIILKKKFLLSGVMCITCLTCYVYITITAQKMFTLQQLHHSRDVHTSTITAQEMFTLQQLPWQHRRCLHYNSCHQSRGDVHTTSAITPQEMFTPQQLPWQHRRCLHYNSCHHSRGDVHTTSAITAQELFTLQELPSQQRRCFLFFLFKIINSYYKIF